MISLSSATLLAQPQDRLTGLGGRPQNGDVAEPAKKKAMALSLPVFDDFSYDSHIPDQTIWEDQNVFVNKTMGTSPPTIGFATFDGLDKDGIAYEIGSLAVDTADILTSQPIDLSNPTDSVYLSFFWQAGGMGETPENNDSLALYFFTPQSAVWTRIWSISSVDSASKFYQEMIPVADAYHKANFQFRFISYGARGGAFDIWNLDYVKLDDSRNFDDTLFADIAFTSPYPSLLSGYESIPWFHYSSGAANKANQNFTYRKNNDGSASQNIQIAVYNISLGGTTLAQDNLGKIDPLNPPSNTEAVYNCIYGNFYPSTVPSNEFEITAYQTYRGSNEDQSPNDTLWRHQEFKNYYAYDDGSPEQAYLVDDNAGGFILTKYEFARGDDLMGLYLYFVPSQYDIESNEFTIVVYANNNGLPGNLIYESDTTYTPRFTSSNFYLPYPIGKDVNSSVAVGSSVFIGIKQTKVTPLPIGYDANNESGNPIIFYGKPNDYYQSPFNGKLLMRPYFRYLPQDFDLPETAPQVVDIEIYPNPTNGILNFSFADANADLSYSIYNLSGQQVSNGKVAQTVQLSGYVADGIYLLEVRDNSGKKAPYTQKLVIKK